MFKKKKGPSELQEFKEVFYSRFLPIYNRLACDFESLRKELATNGVVRDLRKAEKAIATIARQNVELLRKFEALETNGVANAINKLNAEVFKTKKEKRDGYGSGSLISLMLSQRGMDFTPVEEATLAGKVDAIIEHLGLDVTVKPEEVTKAKVVAKKVAAPKKKSRR